MISADIWAARLAAAGLNIRLSVQKAEAEIAEQIAKEWARDAPRDTGRYAESIRSEGNEAFTDVPYARHVIFGTSDTAPQDSLTPAIDRNIEGFKTKVLNKAVEGL